MRALVTGGAGFIGSHLADRLLAEGHEVDVVDDFSTGSLRNLDDATATGCCRVMSGDITAAGFAGWMAIRRPEVVFHLAAQIDVRASVADPRRDASINVLGTVNVLEAARRIGVRKVVNVSSVAIYGTPDRLPVNSATPANPLSPYAASKLSTETYARQYQRLHGVATTTVVLTNVYGPRQCPDSGAVAIWVSALLDRRPTYLYGGSNVRDYLYVTDAVDAIVRTSSADVIVPRVTIGTGVPVTDRQLHDAVSAAVGTTSEPIVQQERLGDLPAMLVDPCEGPGVLGWSPQVSLTEGLAATVAAHRVGMSTSVH
jgi:UDP-glucose 4-epimerase